MASQTQWCIHAAVGQRSLGSGIRSHWVQAADKQQIMVFDFLSSGPSASKMPSGVQQAVSWCSRVQRLPGLYTEARRDWGSWLLPPLPCAVFWFLRSSSVTTDLGRADFSLAQISVESESTPVWTLLLYQPANFFLKILLIFVSWNMHLFCCQIHLSADN